VIALSIQADDEHRPSMAIADGLSGSDDRGGTSLGRAVTDAFSETPVAELVRAAKVLNRIVGVIRSQRRLHRAVMLVAKGKDVRPHRKRV